MPDAETAPLLAAPSMNDAMAIRMAMMEEGWSSEDRFTKQGWGPTPDIPFGSSDLTGMDGGPWP